MIHFPASGVSIGAHVMTLDLDVADVERERMLGRAMGYCQKELVVGRRMQICLEAAGHAKPCPFSLDPGIGLVMGVG